MTHGANGVVVQGPDRPSEPAKPFDPGFAHLALVVDDIDELLARIAAYGWKAQGIPQPIASGARAGTRVIYAVGPDGEDQIIVTTGGQDALNLVFNLLKSHTRQLCIENPCYLGASLIFRSAGLTIHPVPVDGEGLRTDLLPRERGSLLYVTPSHQFPTGAIMTLTRRLDLLRWAEETDSFIIEDDYDSDFRYDGPPLTALAGLDGGRRVFYAGTFSKSVGAGLRIGFATVPRMFWDEARMLKARMSNGQAWLEQAALAAFIDEGHFDRHLRRLRQVYKARRDCLVEALKRTFDGAVIISGESGLHLVWQLPVGFPSARQIQVMARERGIGVYALSSGAAYDFDPGAEDNMLVFGYSSLTETQIGDAVERLRLMLDGLV